MEPRHQVTVCVSVFSAAASVSREALFFLLFSFGLGRLDSTVVLSFKKTSSRTVLVGLLGHDNPASWL